MKLRIKQVLPGILLLFNLSGCFVHTPAIRENFSDQLSSYPKKVAWPFAGIHRSHLIVAGGYTTIVEGETSYLKYHPDIYTLDLTSGSLQEWVKAGILPVPIAQGGTVSTPEGIICIGGTGEGESYQTVFRICWSSGGVICETLPSLPVKLHYIVAAYLDRYVFVVGENGKDEVSFVYRLDLKEGDTWDKISIIPGKRRLLPTVNVVNNGEKDYLYLSSGFSISTDNEPAILYHDLLRYDLDAGRWDKVADLPVDESSGEPVNFTGGKSVITAGGQILFTGGFGSPVFRRASNYSYLLSLADKQEDIDEVDNLMEEMYNYNRHPVEWYQYNRTNYLYDPTFGKWRLIDESDQTARVGAGVVLDGMDLFLIGGEVKPNEQTDAVYRITFQLE